MVKKKSKKTEPQKPRKPNWRLLLGIFAGVVFVIGVLFIPAIIFAKRAMPGTVIFGLDISYKSADEIKELIQGKVELFKKTPQEFVIGEVVYKIFLKDINFELDVQKTLNEVEYIGENGFLSTIKNFHTGKEIKPYVNIEEEMFVQQLRRKVGTRTVRNAGMQLGENGEINLIIGKRGVVLNEEKLEKELFENLSMLSKKQIRVETYIKDPEITKEDLERNLELIKNKLEAEKTLKFGQQIYTIKLIDNLDWVIFDKRKKTEFGEVFGLPESTEEKLEIKIDRAKFQKYIEESLAPEIELKSKEVKIWRDEQNYIHFEGTAEDGRDIQKEKLVQMLELSVNEEVDEFDIPIKTLTHKVDISQDLQDMGVKELLGVGHTTFYGSPANRIHNIRTGIGKFNGKLIAPGETFSFNLNLGEVDGSTGFLKELVIKPEGTLPEYGGGLCQVSTTLYRAALFAGLPIVERTPHSYAVSYYSQLLGYGLDATVYTGVHDIRFTNDTQGHILIQSYTDGMHAYYKFYGTSDGRKTWLEGPYVSNRVAAPTEPVRTETIELPPGAEKQAGNAHSGFDVTWYRYLEKDGETKKETIFTRYNAVPPKIMVGKEVEPITPPASL